MTDLKSQIINSAEKLKTLYTALKKVSRTSLPIKCYERWSDMASLHSVLAATSQLLPTREKYFELLKTIISKKNNEKDKNNFNNIYNDHGDMEQNSNQIEFGLIKMDFPIARHLALTSYICATWAIYDRLFNVCGRLSSISEIFLNTSKNPKLIDIFKLKEKKEREYLGFSTNFHIQQSYEWPIRISYMIRNWLIHEGYEEGDTKMFEGDSICDAYILSEGAIKHLEIFCNHGTTRNMCCIDSDDYYWSNRNLIEILEKYHEEIDTMFSGLIKWSIDSFIGQVAAFSERDKEELLLSTTNYSSDESYNEKS